MRLPALLIIAAFLASACSSPRPVPKRADALLTGQETAEKAGAAAKKAEEEDNTGVIVASSQADEPASQPATSKPDADEPATLTVTFVKGTLTMSGEPVADFPAVARGVAEKDPNTALIIEAEATTPYADVVALMDQAKAAGLTRIEFRQQPAASDDESSDTDSP